MFCFECRFDKVEGNKALCAKTNEYLKIFKKLLFIFPVALQLRLWRHYGASWGCLAILIKYEMCIVFICLAEIFIAGSSSGNNPAIVRPALSAKNKSTCSKHLNWIKCLYLYELFRLCLFQKCLKRRDSISYTFSPLTTILIGGWFNCDTSVTLQ